MAGHQRASLFLEGPGRRFREFATPEGVPLPVELAAYGERAAAFLVDLFFWLVGSIVLALLLVAALALVSASATTTLILMALLIFSGFFIRNLYFIYFELAWQGATPGKRRLGLRVVDRGGGPLLPGAVIARNLTREVEAFLPLGFLLGGGAGGLEGLFLGAWLLGFAALPLFNRARLRGGDFIAGTMVIVVSKRALSGDLAEATGTFAFTAAQLGVYGAFELQVLEELLRAAATEETARLRREVAEKIRRKIGWDGAVAEADTERFLREFYAAERAHLEHAQLFGRGRDDKNAAAPPRALSRTRP
jgi:uncharacterized RDD family membrane protein YckC